MITLVLLTTVGAAVTACGSATRRAATPTTPAGLLNQQFAAGYSEVPAATEQWRAVATADGGRTVVGTYTDASCGIKPDRTVQRIRETQSSVQLTLIAPAHRVPLNQVCLDMLLTPTVRFRLSNPLDGRRILGSTWTPGGVAYPFPNKALPDGSEPDILVPVVFSVLDADRSDAERILGTHGLKARFVGVGPGVVGENPAPGKLAPGTSAQHPYSGVVTLRLGGTVAP